MRLTWSVRSLTELGAIFDYLSESSPRAARKVIGTNKSSAERLAVMPELGRKTDVARIRVLPVIQVPYLVFYTVTDTSDEVHVLSVRHSARRPLSKSALAKLR